MKKPNIVRFTIALASVVAPAVAVRRRQVIRLPSKFPKFPRKESKNFTQYCSERPEMSSQQGIEEARNKKEMKLVNKPNIRFERGLRFSRNLMLVFGLYVSELPETTTQ
jgi:hypothetical protein